MELGSFMTDALLQTLLEAIPTAAALVDENGQVRAANELARRRFPGLTAVPHSDLVVGDRWRVHHVVGSGLLVVVELLAAELRWLTLLEARWKLTPREVEVLAVLAEGLSNEAISLRLCCSTRTVETHVSRLLEKSRQGSRAALIAAAWAVSLEVQARSQWGRDDGPPESSLRLTEELPKRAGPLPTPL
jgi:DNA-binding CsgD family transcriptional regulator